MRRLLPTGQARKVPAHFARTVSWHHLARWFNFHQHTRKVRSISGWERESCPLLSIEKGSRNVSTKFGHEELQARRNTELWGCGVTPRTPEGVADRELK